MRLNYQTCDGVPRQTLLQHGRRRMRPPSTVSSDEPLQLLKLPADSVRHLFVFLPLHCRLSFRAVSHLAYDLASDEVGWAQLAGPLWRVVQGRYAEVEPWCRYKEGLWQEVDDSAYMTGRWCGLPKISVFPSASSGQPADVCARMVPWPTTVYQIKFYSGTLRAHLGVDGPNEQQPVQLGYNFQDFEPQRLRDRTMMARCQGGSFIIEVRNGYGNSWHCGPTIHFGGPNETFGYAMANKPFPSMHAPPRGSENGTPTPRGPLPFATPADALGAKGGWALRLTAYFEIEVHNANLKIWKRSGMRLALGLTHGVSNHEGSEVRIPPPCLLLDIPATEDDEEGEEETAPAALVQWKAGGDWKPERTPIGKFDLLVKGDTLGCCVDYVNAEVFWVKNGKRIANATLPVDFKHPLYPCVYTDNGYVLRMHLGGGEQLDDRTFHFNVLGYEEGLWRELHGRYALRELRKHNVTPSTSFLSSFPTLQQQQQPSAQQRKPQRSAASSSSSSARDGFVPQPPPDIFPQRPAPSNSPRWLAKTLGGGISGSAATAASSTSSSPWLPYIGDWAPVGGNEA